MHPENQDSTQPVCPHFPAPPAAWRFLPGPSGHGQPAPQALTPTLGRQVSTFSDFRPYLRQLVEHLQATGSLRDAVFIEQVGVGARAPAFGHLLPLLGLLHPRRPWPVCALLPIFSLHFGLEATRRRVRLLQEGRGLAPQTRPQLTPVLTHFLRERVPRQGSLPPPSGCGPDPGPRTAQSGFRSSPAPACLCRAAP